MPARPPIGMPRGGICTLAHHESECGLIRGVIGVLPVTSDHPYPRERNSGHPDCSLLSILESRHPLNGRGASTQAQAAQHGVTTHRPPAHTSRGQGTGGTIFQAGVEREKRRPHFSGRTR
eukprot:1193297-Prorocentrum_minimum.AAC.4